MTAVAAADEPRKGGTGGGGGTTPHPSQQHPPPPPPEEGLRCPRCDSPNTKFCYYNNYSLSQPRHFCKACRRYWTKGGRNIPVGGGCRKNKRSRSAAAASRLSLNMPVDGYVDGVSAAVDQKSSARLGFLGGGAPVVSSPIGGAPAAHQSAVAAGTMAPPPLGPAAVDLTSDGGNNGSIVSSIESLSFINQDLHWKLQQQRLSTMFLAPPASGDAAVHHVDGAAPAHVGGGAFLQIAAGAPGMEAVPAVTSWIMDSSYVLPSPPPPATTTAAIAATTNGSINSGRSGGDDDNCGSGIPAWGDMSTFAMLP